MKLKIFIILSILYSPSSFSAQSSKELKKSQYNIGKDLTRLEIKKDTIKKEIKTLKKTISDLHKAQTSAHKKWSATAGGFSYGFGIINQGSGDNQLKKILDDAKSKHSTSKKTLDPKISKLKKELDGINIQISSNEKNISAKMKNSNLQITNLRNQLKSLALNTEFYKLENQFDNIDDTLDEMELIYDKSLIGAYFQDKIGQLLNSQSICKSRKRCLEKKPVKIPAEYIRNELFPETKSRSSYYDKVNSRNNKNGNN